MPPFANQSTPHFSNLPLSAVYIHFGPDCSRNNPGSYAIMKQMEMAEKTERKYRYLGMYVTKHTHLNYKSGSLVMQRLIDGYWVTFEADQS